MTATIDRVLSLARKTAGKYGRPNKYITWYCDKRNLRGAWLTAPWCAIWASYIGWSAGEGKQFGEFAYCPSWVAWFKKNKRWGQTPKVGAVVFYDWDGDGEADHVGIVSKVGKNQIKAIEGNTRVGKTLNWVHEQTRNKSTVLGYGYPKYMSASSAPKATHTVVKGESLSVIAKRHGMSWQALYAANKKVIGSDPNKIKPGQKLVIPHG